MNMVLKISAVLWFIWGAVHILAGVLTVNAVNAGNIAQGFSGIADAVDLSNFELAYPAAVGGILGQHGFNLLWFGIVTLICSVFIWRRSGNAIWLAAIVGGLADLGYFIYLDLGHFVNFVPGTVMTIVSASAIILSFIAYFGSGRLRTQ